MSLSLEELLEENNIDNHITLKKFLYNYKAITYHENNNYMILTLIKIMIAVQITLTITILDPIAKPPWDPMETHPGILWLKKSKKLAKAFNNNEEQ